MSERQGYRHNLAVRMAHERIPLAAIARVLQAPREDVRMELRAAREDGTIAEMPPEDWPPGKIGEYRPSAAPLRIRSFNDDEVKGRLLALDHGLAARGVYLSNSLLRLLLMIADLGMAGSPTLHECIAPHADPKIINVQICKLRQRVRPLGIRIETLWGRGYSMPDASRAMVRDLTEAGRRARIDDVVQAEGAA